MTDTQRETARDDRWYLPKYDTVEEQRQHRKQRLAAGLRIFGKLGFEEGVAGHITARDPERLDHFWVNPFGMSFSHICVSDLLLVNSRGEVVEGEAASTPPRSRSTRPSTRPAPTSPPRRTRTRSTARRGRRSVVSSTR